MRLPTRPASRQTMDALLLIVGSWTDRRQVRGIHQAYFYSLQLMGWKDFGTGGPLRAFFARVLALPAIPRRLFARRFILWIP